MSDKNRFLVFCFSAVLFTIGCAKVENSSSGAGSVQNTQRDRSNDEAADTVSEKEAETFAAQWVEAVESDDLAATNQLIAWEELIARAVEPLGESGKRKRDLIRGGMAGAQTIPKNVTLALEQGSAYRLVSVKKRRNQTYVLFRLDTNEGFNYHLFKLGRIRGRVRADEFHVGATGEEIATTISKNMAAGLKSDNFVGRMTGAQKQFLDDLDLQQTMFDAVAKGQHEKALRIYRRMPKRLQKNKLPMLNRIMATSAEDEKAYLKAVDDFLEVFPEDSAAGMILLDAGALRGDVDLILKSHRSLTKWTGGDPYLDLLVGSNLASLGEVTKAVELTRNTDPEDVGTADAHDYKLAIALLAKDHPETLKQLRVFRDRYDFEFGDLRQAEGFEDFAKSPEFSDWQSDVQKK